MTFLLTAIRARPFLCASLALSVILGVRVAVVTLEASALRNDLTASEAKVSLLQTNNANLIAAVDTQNQRVTELENQAAARAQAAQEALAAAAGEVGVLQDQITDIRAAQGSSCEDADNLINRAFGL